MAGSPNRDTRRRKPVRGHPGIWSRTLANGERRYDVATYEPGHGGQGKKRWRACRTLQEAKDVRARMQFALRSGTYVAPSQVTVGDYTRRRLEERYAIGAIRLSTYEGDARLLRLHLPDRLDRMPIQRATTDDFNDLWAHLAAAGRKDGKPGGLKPRTILRLRDLLHHTLKNAVGEGLVARNAVAFSTRPKKDRSPARAMTREQALRMLEAAKDHWFYPLYVLLIYTGMRRGEACGLQWSSVDLDRGVLKVNDTLIAVAHKPVWSTAKTAAGLREISLDSKTLAVLKEHRARLARARMQLGPDWKDKSDLVFPNPDGSMYNPENIYNRFSRLLKKVGIPHFSIHELRHTNATLSRVATGGTKGKELSTRLGHASTRITEDMYQHVTLDRDREVAELLGAYMHEVEDDDPLRRMGPMTEDG